MRQDTIYSVDKTLACRYERQDKSERNAIEDRESGNLYACTYYKSTYPIQALELRARTHACFWTKKLRLRVGQFSRNLIEYGSEVTRLWSANQCAGIESSPTCTCTL